MLKKLGQKYQETALIKLIAVGLVLGILLAVTMPQAVATAFEYAGSDASGMARSPAPRCATIVGTGFPAPSRLKAGYSLSDTVVRRKGNRYVSRLLGKMIFSSYSESVPIAVRVGLEAMESL